MKIMISKKKAVLFSIICIVSIILVKKGMEYNYNYLKESFHSWDMGEIYDNKTKKKIIEQLAEYINKCSIDELDILETISPYIKIFKEDNIILINYIENCNYYGTSGRDSYLIVKWENNTSILYESVALNPYDFIFLDENEYLLLCHDYRFSNNVGIYLIKLSLNNSTLVQRTIETIINDELPSSFYMDLGNLRSYTGYIESRIEDKNIIFMDGDKKEYLLEYSENEGYSFQLEEK